LVLCLSANTSFADFPRVCRTIALDGYLPSSFAVRGRRLVFTEGIVVLTGLAAVILILFDGVTDKLIPLFAIGAFLAFTLSQAGMVKHWLKSPEPRARLSAAINCTGAIATGITFLIVIVTKFAEGAWLVIIVTPALYFFMRSIKRHYSSVAKEIGISGPIRLIPPGKMIAVVPIDNINAVAQKALEIAYSLTSKVYVLHIERENSARNFSDEWYKDVHPAIVQLGLQDPEVVILQSPFRKVIAPTLDYIWKLEREYPETSIAVLIPQLIESHWYYSFLHNQRASILRTVLLLKGRNRIVIVNVPWNIEKQLQAGGHARMETWDQSPKWLDT